jgi:conjugative relaxase-like TrwC/TraI family protein
MLNATQSKSIAGAVKYFETVLTQGDYYLGSDIAAHWQGRTAQLLGLDTTKQVTKKEFEALLSGKHPVTGKKLAQRMRKDRRPGIDFTFSVPKSVSLAWAINGDERIIETLKDTVRECMERDIEPLMHRRVRDGANANTTNRKKTGNLLYCPFLHKTSRPVEHSVDPHLHVHAFAINLTADQNRFFAAEFAEVMRQLPSLQSKFDARLARKLDQQLGYTVEKVSFKQSGRVKTGWEIKGVERSTIEKFSQRTNQIELTAAAEGVTDAAKKSRLGKKTRQKKDTEIPVDRLREDWDSRLTRKERKAFAALRAGAIGKGTGQAESQSVQSSLEFAIEHHLFRQSTIEKHHVVSTALQHGLCLSPEQVEEALHSSEVIARTKTIDGADRNFITTQEVLDAEKSMIEFARDSRGTRYTLATQEHTFKRDWLNDQQKNAVSHVLGSRDTVMAVTGGAGTGKTSLMKEAVEAIEQRNKQVFTFAPSTGAREVLVVEGFENAQTVEHLIRNNKLHESIKAGDVLWIDEAGLLDVRSMNGVFKIAEQQKARVVLSGDTRQHSSPRRGEAMRLLESEAGLNVVRIEKIQRQKGLYKKAVEFISMGQSPVAGKNQTTGLLAGFDLLDRLGKIKEIESGERHEILAQQYLANTTKKKSTLVVAPTRSEGEAITEEIRSRRREAGAIGKKNVDVRKLDSLYLSDAQKSESASYQTGMVVQFHQNAKGGFKRGERYRVEVETNGVVLRHEKDGSAAKPLPASTPNRFEVYSDSSLPIAIGDKVRFSLGGTAMDRKRRFSNGRIDEIKNFDRRGNLVLKSGMKVDRNFGHLDHGYVVTSHGSQGKTTKVAIAAMGSESLPAINAKQFYVTVSRGSEDVAIYVDSKARIRRAIQDAGQQLSATELVKQTDAKQGIAQRQLHQQRSFFQGLRNWWNVRKASLTKKHAFHSGFQQSPSPKISR